MNKAFQTILDSLSSSPKAARSQLEPYADLILELHRRGWSYRKITGILHEHCGITVRTNTVYNFVRVRSKRKAEATADHRALTSHSSVTSPLSEADDVNVRMGTPEPQPVAPAAPLAAARPPAASEQPAPLPASAGYVRSSDKSRRTSGSTGRYAAAREQMRKDKETPIVPVAKRKLFEYTDEDASTPLGRSANPSKE